MTTTSNLASFFPKAYPITSITNANPVVITTIVPHLYSTGNLIRIFTPTFNNMPQINGKFGIATILSPTTFSLPIDSTSFSAYTYSAVSPGQSIPIAEVNKTLVNAVDNKGPRNP